jgi:hypothetical protein
VKGRRGEKNMCPVFMREKKVSRFERRKGFLSTASEIRGLYRPTDWGEAFGRACGA